MIPDIIRMGSRGSALALAQTNWIKDRILARYPQLQVTTTVIKTSADKHPGISIRAGTATGVWVKELEEALLFGRVDVAVHSMKDLPSKIPDSLEINSIPEREDACDALVARHGVRALSDLPRGAAIGTGSIRRQAQVLAARPDLEVRDIRGNIDTRLQKLDRGDYDAVILACAGLHRLGLQSRITSRLELRQMLPAPGQGALALETRRGDARMTALLAGLHHAPTAVAVLAERVFLRQMGGGCNSPIAVHTSLEGDRVVIDGMIATPDGKKLLRDSVCRLAAQANEAASELADLLLRQGGSEILSSLGRLP
jgi:hydroxymethylbilane synthase